MIHVFDASAVHERRDVIEDLIDIHTHNRLWCSRLTTHTEQRRNQQHAQSSKAHQHLLGMRAMLPSSLLMIEHFDPRSTNQHRFIIAAEMLKTDMTGARPVLDWWGIAAVVPFGGLIV